MAKYKCLNDKGYGGVLEIGVVYDDTYSIKNMFNTSCNIGACVRNFPEDWEDVTNEVIQQLDAKLKIAIEALESIYTLTPAGEPVINKIVTSTLERLKQP